MPEWEYDIVELELGINIVKEVLSRLGKEGWELVDIIHYPNPREFKSDASSPYFGYFKRSTESFSRSRISTNPEDFRRDVG